MLISSTTYRTEKLRFPKIVVPKTFFSHVGTANTSLSQLSTLIAPSPSPSSNMLIPITLTIIALLLLLHILRSFRNKTALVISLSPANHSPRALAHASLLSSHINTILLALPPFPQTTSSIIHHSLTTTNPSVPLLLKLFTQSLSLCRALLQITPYNVSTIILNTPPVIPTLPILLFFRPLFPTASFIIDWHNLAYTLMPQHSQLTTIAKFIEKNCAPFATHHWTVSKAMANFLNQNFSINPTVLYDTPRAHFITSAHQLTHSKRLTLFTDLTNIATRIGPSHPPDSTNILVTSTSWTPDEDFNVLFQALQTIDQTFTPLILVITGRGPLRAHFETRFRDANFINIAVWFAWLPIADYPRLLASATLGVSLHASSSGLDLPMKVVDMLACGLPPLALRYKCIHELVKDGHNGFLFDDANQLATLLRRLLVERPADLSALRKRVRHSFKQDMQWENYWRNTALPTIPTLS